MSVVIREFFTRWGFQTDQPKLDAFVSALDTAKGEAIAAGVGASLFNGKVKALVGTIAISTVKVLKMFSALNTLKNLMIATAAAGIGLTATFFRLVTETAKAAQKTEQYAKALGLSSEGLAEWEFVLKRTGGSVNAFKSAIATLADAQLAAKEGSKSARKAFDGLNVPIKKLKDAKPEELFLAVADGIKEIKNPTELMARLIRLFGKEVAVELEGSLLKGRDALQALKEEGRDLGLILSAEDFENAKKFNAALVKLKDTFTGFKTLLAKELLPVFTEFLEAKGEFSPEDRQQIIKGIVSGARAFTKALRVAIKISRVFQSGVKGLIDAMGGFEKIIAQAKIALLFFITFQVVSVVTGFILLLQGMLFLIKLNTGGLGALRVAMIAFGKATFAVFVKLVLIPAIITAIIVLIILLLEDIKVFAEGGKSAIGDLLQEFPEIEEGLENFEKAVHKILFSVIEAFDDMAVDIRKIFRDLTKENAFGEWLELLRKDIDRTLGDLKKGFEDFTQFIEDLVPQSVSDALKNAQAFLERAGVFEAGRKGGIFDTTAGSRARTPDITGALAPRQGGNVTINRGPTTIQVTQQPGESPERFAARVVRIEKREQALDTNRAVSVFTPVFDR